jgi:hypothetical protein
MTDWRTATLSIVRRILIEREAILGLYRTAYLRSVAAECGMPSTDLRPFARMVSRLRTE